MNDMKFFDQFQCEIPCPTFIRGVSDDNAFSLFYCSPIQGDSTQANNDKIPPKVSQMQQESQSLSNTSNIPQFNKYTTFKQQKQKQRTQNPQIVPKQRKDYKKNICGYITKKIVRQFISQIYKQKVLQLCEKHQCQYLQCITFYDLRIQRITGPTHLDMLLKYNLLTQGQNIIKIKKCFKQFFMWFLRYRYLRYLIIQGKMERKDIYIDYKNKTLLYLGSCSDSKGQE